jgi:hypothetical protein
VEKPRGPYLILMLRKFLEKYLVTIEEKPAGVVGNDGQRN